MINFDATDNLEGLASITNVVEFTFSGVDGATVVSKEGKLTTSQTTIHTAAGIVRGYSLTLYNGHSAAVTVTISKDPTDAGTLYRLFSISLGIGYTLLFDGTRLVVLDTNGVQVSGLNVSDTAYAASWDGVTDKAPSKNAVYDQMELKAPLISPSLVTPALGTPASGVLTSCTGLPQAGTVGLLVTDGPTFDHVHLTSGQVGFPATAVPSANANTLDDYEEGTWTPIVGGDAVYNINSGSYIKVGNLVTITGVINIAVLGTGSAGILSGFPFVAENVEQRGSVSINYIAASAVTFIYIVGYIVKNTSTAYFVHNTALGAGLSSISLFGDGTNMYFSCSYITS